jgi:hypothetical protein
MMDQRDREAIEELFQKIAEVERRSGPRDNDAEAFIRAKIAQHPAAPYYMAQTIVVQEEALNEAERRIAELESGAGQGQGGLLGGLFGGGRPERHRRYAPAAGPSRQAEGPWGHRRPAGGGFLAGAAQTAMGVAGGVLLGNMIADLFSPDAAAAAEADAGFDDTGEGAEAGTEADVGGADAGGDFGGDFDLGSF